MKLLILLAVAGLSNSAKLDNTYLPPENAPAAGGSENFLQTPISGSPNEYQRNTGFGQRGSTRNNANNLARNGNNFVANVNKFAQNGQEVSLGQNTVAQANNFSPTVNGFEAQNNYAQSANAFTQDTGAFVQPNYAQNDNFAQSVSFESRPERPRAALERNAAILRQDTQNNGETYAYAFETENGITAEENGVATNGVEAQGGFSYVGDDGQIYSIRYTADQNGFVPQGDHLPTPPPVPAEILKALEDNARDEANGIFDDGSYNAAKYGDNNFAGYNENANVGNFASNIGNNNQVFNGINQGFNDASKGDQGYNSVSNVNQGSNGVDNSNQAFNTGVSTGINYNNNAAEDDTVITDNAQLRTQGAQTPYNENQGLRSQGSNLAQRNQAGFNQGGLDNQANFGQRNQFVGNQRQSNQLPRFGQENQGSRNQGFARSGSRAYLPPVQRSNGESARRQSYDPRTGYQY